MEQGDATSRADQDLEQAEVMESAGMQNAAAVAGPAAILMLPVAWVLIALGRLLRRLVRSR